MHRHLITSVGLAAALSLACQEEHGGQPATAQLQPLADSGVGGNVEFTPLTGAKIRINAEVTGLAPGSHGIHIHEFGDCSDSKGLSAGEHFNPEGVAHGGPTTATHHVGDLGNITADAGGRGVLTIETDEVTLDRGPRGILGRSVVVHSGADDFMTQPSGGSGDRIACGVIRARKGQTEPVLPGEDSQ